MNDPLAIYLHDHHAGAKIAIETLEWLRDQHRGQALGKIADDLLMEVQQDRATLQRVIERVDEGAPLVRDAAAWVSEKAMELKLRRGAFGTFEALEALALGVLGKLKLWDALAKISEIDERLRGMNFSDLSSRARLQHVTLEQCRMESIEEAFAPALR
jgi:hypothetical protein